MRSRGAAHPFVLFLDGRLIGELGVDAVDETSGTGEASVWMVRDHGPSAVMTAGSLLLTYSAFCRDKPLSRLVSPVATSSRRGRAPGLQAAGLTIEATLPRPLGRGVAVDHDIWVLHNTAPVRSKAERAVDSLSIASAGNDRTESSISTFLIDSAVLIRAAVLVGLRAAIRRVRSRGLPPAGGPQVIPFDGRHLVHHADGRVESDDDVIGTVRQLVDVGTATAALVVRVDRAAHADAVRAVLTYLIDDAVAWADAARWLQVRLPPSADGFAAALTAAGFAHVASFSGNAEGPRSWAGEEWWSRPTGLTDRV